MSTRQRKKASTPKACWKRTGRRGNGLKAEGHACPRKRRRGDKRVRAKSLSLKRNGQRFCKGTEKEETRKLCLTSAGEILCRSPGPHPGGQTLTLPGVATPRKAGPGRPGPIGRPAASCFQSSPAGPGSPRATLGVRARVWDPDPGARARARVPVHLPVPVGRVVGPGRSLLSGKATGRVAHTACPVFRGLVRRVGRWSGGSPFPRFSFELVGQAVISPLGRLAIRRSSGPPAQGSTWDDQLAQQGRRASALSLFG